MLLVLWHLDRIKLLRSWLLALWHLDRIKLLRSWVLPSSCAMTWKETEPVVLPIIFCFSLLLSTKKRGRDKGKPNIIAMQLVPLESWYYILVPGHKPIPKQTLVPLADTYPECEQFSRKVFSNFCYLRTLSCGSLGPSTCKAHTLLLHLKACS